MTLEVVRAAAFQNTAEKDSAHHPRSPRPSPSCREREATGPQILRSASPTTRSRSLSSCFLSLLPTSTGDAVAVSEDSGGWMGWGTPPGGPHCIAVALHSSSICLCVFFQGTEGEVKDTKGHPPRDSPPSPVP